MARFKLSEIYKVLAAAILINLLFAVSLYPWVTADDVTDLPEDPIDKFVTLFTFGLATFTTSGFVNTNAKSRRLKLFSAIYVVLVISGLFSYFFNF